MDGLIGSYGGVSDEEAMEYEEEASSEPAPANVADEEEEDIDRILAEIEDEKSGDEEQAPSPEPVSSNNSSFNNNNLLLPGLSSYSSHSPGRTQDNSVPLKTALTSLLATYEDLDKTNIEEKDEEDIEKQYDVTVENSDSDSDTENFMGKLDDEENPKIPPEPKGKCSSKLQDKISNEIHKRKKTGYDFCNKMRMNKEFRNPSIYDKLIDMIGINETGTNFTDPILNKSSWKTESFYKQLADKQQKEYDRKEAERKKERDNDPNSKIKLMVIADKEKRTKWDDKFGPKDKLDKQLKAQLIQDKLNKQLQRKNNS